MKSRIRFLIAATLLLSLAALPSFAGTAKRGWTKVHLTRVYGQSGPIPASLLQKAGGELLVDYTTHAVGYVPKGAVASLQNAARAEGIVVAPRDDFDVMILPSSARVDAREGIGDDVPRDGRMREYPARKPGLFLIQFVGPARKEWIEELTSMGWRMDRYIPSNGYIIAGTPELIGRTRQLSYIQFLDFFHPYQKAKHLNRDGQARDLVFELSSSVDPAEGIAAIEEAAENGVEIYRGNLDTLVFARLSHDKAEPLLHHPLIISVSPRPTGAFSDERQVLSLTSNVNAAGSAPTSPTSYMAWLSGRCPSCASMSPSTWRIGLADTGLDDGTDNAGHADLLNRKYYGDRLYSTSNHDTCPSATLPNCDRVGHGTIVAGIMAGNAATGLTDDGGFYWGMGVAPWAGVFSTKVGTLVDNYAIDFARLFEFTRDAANNSVTIQNHSFNEYSNQTPYASGLYTTFARNYDIAVRDADDSLSTQRKQILIAVSAGNTDHRGVNDPNRRRVLPGGTAKNVLSVGGVENNHPELDDCYADGSDFRNLMAVSRNGTLLPGYIKPDLVAPAAPVGSTNSTALTADNGYCVGDLPQFEPVNGVEDRRYNGDSGTSFAAPVGAAASLIVKRYLDPSSPSATSPALAKAMLIAGAKSVRGGLDMTAAPGTTIGAMPNGQQGFGRISFDDIITGSTPPLVYDQSTVRSFTFSGETGPFRIRLKVRDASKPVKVALVWTDAPATAYEEQVLVNDLDLEVYPTTLGATKYVGNYLQVTDPNKGEESKPVWYYDDVEGRDRSNNVEVVRAFMTSNEEFDVQVEGLYIWGDTDGNTSTFEQDFALVVLNADRVNSGNPVAPRVWATRDPNTHTTTHIGWTAAANLMDLEYEVWRGTNVNNMQLLGTTPYEQWGETNLPENTTYLYKVVAKGAGGASATSNYGIATTIDWGFNPIFSNTISIKALHWTDLRRGVDYVRTASGLATNTWTSTIASGGWITAAQLTELRSKLAEAFTTLGNPAPTYSTPAPTPDVTFIKAADVTALRSAIE